MAIVILLLSLHFSPGSKTIGKSGSFSQFDKSLYWHEYNFSAPPNNFAFICLLFISMVLNQGQFCIFPFPPANIWQFLKTFLIFMTWGVGGGHAIGFWRCDEMGNIYLVFVLGYWHRATKTPGLSRVITMSLACWWDDWWLGSLDGFRVGAHEKEKARGAGQNLQAHPPTGEGWRTGGWPQSPMANELINSAYIIKSPLKLLNNGVRRALGLVTNIRCWEDDVLGEGVEVLCPPTHTRLQFGCSITMNR